MDWKQPLRFVIARSPRLQRVQQYRRVAIAGQMTASFWEMTPEQALRVAYNVLLRREPDPTGVNAYLSLLQTDVLPRDEFVQRLRGSEEFRIRVPFQGPALPHSLHMSRCEFVQGLPPASRILDLGGSHHAFADGAMLTMGYPYLFERLVIVDLPSDERHPLYRSNEHGEVVTPLGPVHYRYHSMADLSEYDDESFDLVYSGQSIEHVTEEEGALVLKDVLRILRPGGFFALDTPNARATRLQQEEFIDPDHKVEYTHAELSSKLQGAGFAIRDAKGLNYLGRSFAEGRFDWDDAAGHQGVFEAIEDCYLLAYVCQKPA